MTTEDKSDSALITYLGFITLSWSLLDHLLTSTIIWLTKLEAIDGVVLADRMTVTRKIDVIKILLAEKHFDQKAIDDFDSISDEIGKTATRRNTITHGMWLAGTAPNSMTFAVIRTFGTIKLVSEDITPDEARKLADKIGSLTRDLLNFVNRNGISPTPQTDSQPTVPPPS